MTVRTYNNWANFVVSAHFLWTLFLLGGAAAMLVYPSYAIVQIIAMTGTLLIAVPFGNTCPLTLLEERWRKKSDPTYRNGGSYIAAYVNKFFNKNIPVRRVNETIAGLYVITYALAIALLILRGNGFLGG
jgi:hypothetical protein